MFQIIMTRAEYRDIKYVTITPELLYTKIKDMGYDWNKLLDTRGYWLIDQYDLDIDKPFLSTPDLINMFLEEYHPWWYPKENIKNARGRLIAEDTYLLEKSEIRNQQSKMIK